LASKFPWGKSLIGNEPQFSPFRFTGEFFSDRCNFPESSGVERKIFRTETGTGGGDRNGRTRRVEPVLPHGHEAGGMLSRL